jgi:tRNA-dihydrouridine synthase B
MIHEAQKTLSVPAFKIGSIPILGRLILAPMDGYTDHPFRLICRRWGSACTYSEFINGMDFEGKHPHIEPRLYFQNEERPFGYQILDNNPERILKAAQQLRQRNPDFFDVNLGCCSRSVCSRGAGASLLLDPEKVSRIIKLLVENLDIPITAKIRLGWDDTNRNYLEIARRVEQAGAAVIAVHGRTRVQAYTGKADWDAIAEVKQLLNIPVIGNGDVKTSDDIDTFLQHTKCDAIMIGRAAIGNPWIFSRKQHSNFSRQEIYETMKEHLLASVAFYGEEHGLVVFRKQTVEYLKNEWPSTAIRRDILTTTDWRIYLEKIHTVLMD